MPPRRASSGLYDNEELSCDAWRLLVQFGSSKKITKVQTRLNYFKYFHIFLYVFASYVKGRPINQNSKTTP